MRLSRQLGRLTILVVVAGVKLTVNLSRHELSRISYKAQAGLDNTLKVSNCIVKRHWMQIMHIANT